MDDLTPLVFIVDDDASVRTGLERLLRSAGFAVELYASAAAYLQRTDYNGVGCLVLDVRMPGVDGMTLQERLAERGVDIPIVFLTGYGEVPTSVDAMKKGAVDFLTKPVDEQALLRALQDALARHRRIRAERLEASKIRARAATLTPREMEVMRCMLTGALNKSIAAHLGIAEKTVKIHRGRVMGKMGVSSIAELVRACAMAGITPTALT